MTKSGFERVLAISAVVLLVAGALSIAAFPDSGLAYSQSEPNSPPIANDDAITAREDEPLAVAAADLLSNDFDPDTTTGIAPYFDHIFITSVSGASISENGTTIAYMPDPDFYGRDSFNYTISDTVGATDTATVHVLVLAEKDAPAAAGDTFAVDSNSTSAIDVLANDSDPDGTGNYDDLAGASAAGTASAQGQPPYGFVNAEGALVAYYRGPDDLPRRTGNATGASTDAPLGTAYARILDEVSALEQAAQNASSAASAAQAEYDEEKSNEPQRLVLEENLKAAQVKLSEAQNALNAGYARLKASPSLYGLLAGEKGATDQRLGLLESGGEQTKHSPMAPARVTMKQGHSQQELQGMESDGIRLVAHHDQAAVIHVSAEGLDKLVQIDSVSHASLPKMARAHDHHPLDGATFARANLLYNAGINGSGITVAVIDNSFVLSDPIFNGSVSHMSLHDSAMVCGGSIGCGETFQSSHGTSAAGAVLEAAPGATLDLYVIGGSVDFANATQDILARGKADIITASLGFSDEGGTGPDGWFRDGTSASAKQVDQARAADILVAVSTGNEGISSWRGAYVPSQAVAPGDIMLDGTFGKAAYQSVMEFSPNAIGIKKACLPVGIHGSALLSWNDWPDTSQDYDLFLYDSSARRILHYSADNQSATREPLEQIHDASALDACLIVASYNSAQNQQIYVEVDGAIAIAEFFTGELPNSLPSRLSYPSINTPADARGATAVGAVLFNTGVLEPYSSVGPTDDGRPKPEICAPGETRAINGGSLFGTSASASYAAGGAALLMQLNPGMNATEIEALMLSGADKSAAYQAQDNVCGAGSLSMLGAFYSDQMAEVIEASSGGPLRVSAVTEPSHGTARISADGSAIEYAPDAGHTGPDSFEYTVSDPDGLTDSAAVSVTVLPPPSTVEISSPTAGQEFSVFGQVPLRAAAADAGGNDASGSIAWRSNVTGYLGSGGNTSAALPYGAHRITAHAVGPDGAGFERSVDIRVVPSIGDWQGGHAPPGIVDYLQSSGTQVWLRQADASQLPDASEIPAGFPGGFFEWGVSGIDPGSTETIWLYTDPGYPPSAAYWAVSGGSWHDASTSLGSRHDGSNHLGSYALKVRDGGPYDKDGKADGRASGFGGLGIARQTQPDPSALAPRTSADLGEQAVAGGGPIRHDSKGLEVSASSDLLRYAKGGQGALGVSGGGSDGIDPGQWVRLSFDRPASNLVVQMIPMAPPPPQPPSPPEPPEIPTLGQPTPPTRPPLPPAALQYEYRVTSYDAAGEKVGESTAKSSYLHVLSAGLPGASAVRIEPLTRAVYMESVSYQDYVPKPHYAALEGAMAARFSFDAGDARNSAGPQLAHDSAGVSFGPGGISGGAAHFGGSGYIDMQYSEALGFGTGSYTVSAWVSADSGSLARVLAMDTTATGIPSNIRPDAGWVMWLAGSRPVHAVTGGTDTYRSSCGSSCSTASDGDMHHLAVSVDSYKNDVEMWYDGKIVTSSSGHFGQKSPDKSVGLRIGGVPEAGDVLYALNGTVDELMLFDRPLSGDEIRQLASPEYYQ